MQDFFDVLAIIAPILVALILGFAVRKYGILTQEGIDGLKALVMNFALPAVLFGAFYNADFGVQNVIVAAVIFACCIAGLLFGKLLVRIFHIRRELLPFLTTGFEAGMMGYGLYMMLFSEGRIANFAMVDLGQVLFVFTIYMALLNMRKGVSGKETLRSMLKSPIFLSIVAGVIVGVTGLGRMLALSPAGETVDTVLSYIGAPTGVLMLFVVGYGLRFTREELKGAFQAALCRLLIMAGLCAAALFVLNLLIPLSAELYWAVVLMFTLPAPFVLPVFADKKEDAGYVSTGLSIYALISVALFTCIVILR